ncbi:uncharacterized protein PG986_014212 [Apiospora aurea]|uniref:Ankyrin n=1 Tax=Apiospora aurea TaxID=335848 RepID=A0ABR1PTC9_9PEZI
MYRTEVLWTEQKERNERWEGHPFKYAWEFRAVEWDGPLTPFSGRFPHEVTSPQPRSEKWCYDTDDEEENENAGPSAVAEEPPRWKGLSMLQWACSVGNTAVAQKVLDVAERVWKEYIDYHHNDSLHSAIHFAAWYGRTNILRVFETIPGSNKLLMNWISGFRCIAPRDLGKVFGQINPDIGNEVPFGYSTNYMQRPFTLNPLGIAILRGHREAAEYLVRFYDDTAVDDLTNDEQTGMPRRVKVFDPIVHPLHLACYMGMTDVVKAIVDKGGADVNTISAPLAFATALMLAAARPDNDDIIDFLLEHGADATIQGSQKRTALEWALQFGAPENARRMVAEGCPADVWLWSGRSYCALYLSMLDDANFDVTQAIFRKHPDLPDLLWRVCLNLAIRSRNSCERTIRWCVEHDLGLGPISEGELTEDMPSHHHLGLIFDRSALHCVASHPALPLDVLASVLEKRPQDINLSDEGWTPLCSALANGHNSPQVALLLSKGADPAACPEKQRAILAAAREGKSDAEIEAIKTRYRTAREIERDEYLAQQEAENAEDYRKAAAWGIGPRQWRQMHRRSIRMAQMNDLRSFGMGVDEVIAFADAGWDAAKLELERLLAEEKEGRRRRDESWKEAYPDGEVSGDTAD